MKCKSAGSAKDQADKYFSWAIRASARFTCEKCGRKFDRPTWTGREYKGIDPVLQCSHFYSRKHNSTRWHPENAFAHCAPCHAWLESRTPDFNDFYLRTKGRIRYDRVMAQHHKTVNYSKHDFEAIAEHFKSEIDRIETLLDSGFGRIELRAWDD